MIVVDRRAQRLSSIVVGTTRLFHERGYEATSVNDLAAALEMSVGGLYRYIDTKSDLLVMVCEDIYGDLPGRLEAIAEDPAPAAERLTKVLDAYLESCVESRALILLMYREYRHLPREAQVRFQQREETIAALLERLIAEGVAAGDFTPTVDAWTLAHDAVLIGHLPALKSFAVRAARRSERTVTRAQVQLILHALGVDVRK